MKRTLFLLVAGCALLGMSATAADGPMAVLYKKDGRAWRVTLIQNGGEQLTIRLEKGSASIQTPVDEIERLKMDHPDYDLASAEDLYNRAEYAAVIKALEPVAAPAAEYMGIQNNLQDAFLLLTRAYYEHGDTEKARAAAARLCQSRDETLKLFGRVYAALTAVQAGDLQAAETARQQIDDPAAALYVQAFLERAQGKPVQAIQTAVQLIAKYPNDMDWMPRTELLCAELYEEMGMIPSAEATARQTAKFYAGMHVAPEAQALRSKLSESTEQPE